MLNSPYVKSIAPAAIIGVGTHVVVGKPAVTALATVVVYALSVYMMVGGSTAQ